jgi:hypothetical protein
MTTTTKTTYERIQDALQVARQVELATLNTWTHIEAGPGWKEARDYHQAHGRVAGLELALELAREAVVDGIA